MSKEVSNAPDLESADPLLGVCLLDRYLVQAVIGRGGMSVVYRAHDLRLSRPVAVKVFSNLVVADAGVARAVYEHFVQEAYALSKLNHPNTIRIYDLQCLTDAPKNAPFQVSEFMDGGTLADLVRQRGPLPVPEALAIAEAVGGALTEAHALKIVHRDVKPTNILFGYAGRQCVIKLADFSVAQACKKSVHEVSRMMGEETEVSPVSFYSLGWSAPEQIRGEEVDPSADVYGLALTLGFMVTGLRLRDLRTKADFYRPASELDDMLAQSIETTSMMPSWLGQVCLRACRAVPTERFQTIDAMMTALRAGAHAAGSEGPTRELRLGGGSPPAAVEAKRIVATKEPPEGRAQDDRRQGDAKDGGPTTRIAAMAPASLEKGEPREIVTIPDIDHSNTVARGRRIRTKAATRPIDLESQRGARVRALFLPGSTDRSLLQLRGLNCFLISAGGSPTSGLAIQQNTEVELMGTDRARLGVIHVRLGQQEGTERIFRMRNLSLALGTQLVRDAVCLEFEEETDLFLLYRKH
ncbi:MAG: serine/threonine protein kinase [Deltaproteobacteria bacterium]|nr:serine/threonine protein kinase [Deltaproteobacteria bacterium]